MTPAPNPTPPTPLDLTTVPWEGIHDATRTYSALSKWFKDSPFLIAMHGSLPRDCFQGNDLDLIATQWRESDMPRDSRLRCVIQIMVKFPGMIFQSYERVTQQRAAVKFYWQDPTMIAAPPPRGIGCPSPKIIDLLVVML